MCHNASQQLVWHLLPLKTQIQSLRCYNKVTQNHTNPQNALLNRFSPTVKEANTVCFMCNCIWVRWRAASANVSTIGYKLILSLPWSPSAEKYKWVTKGVRQRKWARQTDSGRLCMNIKARPILPLPDVISVSNGWRRVACGRVHMFGSRRTEGGREGGIEEVNL